ncbi:Na(+)-translocating NADH-quinone reductase subunit A [Cryomorpha ignava]|uniref:Na(+)-translocating NADH-quinone reductase subunit A n=1 Tax=Cryomorpha ignava TaxID=101383 RepID=A0A7K3WSH0_9FLAO|nr:Na(+)-translocating NADH-quinone reductase subunit A [Cryomorpha ignava]NEN23595.1 Na(+)-translocating NADH-quinone reductase subunit A [Cryomorpha ignava]
MSKAIKITKGVDIKLVGAAENKISPAQRSNVYAIKPDDFFGTVPKLMVKQGETVKAGTPLFFDKKRDKIKFTSPVSGEVVEIKRGDKRKILEVKILADSETAYASFTPWTGGGDRQTLVDTMLGMGLWPFITQRPYGVIASPDDTPRDIYISGFDSAPLSADNEVALKGEIENFKTGLEALKILSGGHVHLGVRKGSSLYAGVNGVEKTEFSGPHPVGNVGVQIHHTKPINKGEVLWTVNPSDVAIIGKSLKEGKFRAERTIALAGSEVKNPQYYSTIIGASIESILGDNEKAGHNRIISGNVLTGTKVERDGYLSFYSNMVSIIPEGDEKKFFITEGWLAPGFSRFSLNHSYPSWLLGNKKYKLDTNLNGETRAFVVTGELEKVFPFDIYPMQLIKAIMINDIDSMENLGIYEVLPEDFALCEFACTSKINIQSVVRQGLADMRNEFAS